MPRRVVRPICKAMAMSLELGKTKVITNGMKIVEVHSGAEVGVNLTVGGETAREPEGKSYDHPMSLEALRLVCLFQEPLPNSPVTTALSPSPARMRVIWWRWRRWQARSRGGREGNQ